MSLGQKLASHYRWTKMNVIYVHVNVSKLLLVSIGLTLRGPLETTLGKHSPNSVLSDHVRREDF